MNSAELSPLNLVSAFFEHRDKQDNQQNQSSTPSIGMDI
ncbi:hypothetical protein PS655_03454 [Pseudomonas fluorescens]|uniref:Uncharacterized protein n=1 Tax=Pseudomonas fluorescens TaxID=294 RepID=A0A5E6USS3_PSEFL|nr:hypothetical protein PS655_03454 [Pseudomonas fluorescens]